MLEEILKSLSTYGPLGIIAALFAWYINQKDKLIATKDQKLEDANKEKVAIQQKHQEEIIQLGEKAMQLNQQLLIALNDTGEIKQMEIKAGGE